MNLILKIVTFSILLSLPAIFVEANTCVTSLQALNQVKAISFKSLNREQDIAFLFDLNGLQINRYSNGVAVVDRKEIPRSHGGALLYGFENGMKSYAGLHLDYVMSNASEGFIILVVEDSTDTVIFSGVAEGREPNHMPTINYARGLIGKNPPPRE